MMWSFCSKVVYRPQSLSLAKATVRVHLPSEEVGCPHIMSDNFRGFQTPPPSLVM